MVSMDVEIELKKGEPQGAMGKIVKRAIQLSRIELKGNLQRNSPVDEGKMQGGWFMASVPSPGGKVYSSAKYTSYVNDGTGIYGPKGKKIVPKTKKALKFVYKGNEVVVKSVKGIKPRRFVEKSITQTEKRSDEFVIRATLENQGDL